MTQGIDRQLNDALCQRFELRGHVYACHTLDHVVLLDTRRGRYLGVPALVGQILGPRIRRWPCGPGRAAGEFDIAERDSAAQVLSQMLQERLLARIGSYGGASSDTSVVLPPRAQLEEGYEFARPRLRWKDPVRFLWAVALTWAKLNLRSIESLAKDMQRRRATALKRMTTKAGARHKFDRERTRVAVAQFEWLYRLLFSEGDRCLFKSAALQEYLFTQLSFPRMVIGVATGPFAAHCWLQEDDIVINDEQYRVRMFTPIIAI